MEIKITKENKKSNWVEGTCGDYTFLAQVWDEPSERGIEGSAVSRLFVSHKSTPLNRVIDYDREWYTRPSLKNRYLYETIMNIINPDEPTDMKLVIISEIKKVVADYVANTNEIYKAMDCAEYVNTDPYSHGVMINYNEDKGLVCFDGGLYDCLHHNHVENRTHIALWGKISQMVDSYDFHLCPEGMGVTRITKN